MLISTLKTAYEIFQVGVTLIDGYGKVRDLISGTTVTTSLNDLETRIGDRLDRIEQHVALSSRAEFEGLEWAPSNDLRNHLSTMRGLARAFDADIVQSRPAIPPGAFVEIFRENPERLLTHVTPLKGVDIAPGLLRDPTMLPVIFEKDGVQCIGWAKEAAVSLSLGASFTPRIAPKPVKPLRLEDAFPLVRLMNGPPLPRLTLDDILFEYYRETSATVCLEPPYTRWTSALAIIKRLEDAPSARDLDALRSLATERLFVDAPERPYLAGRVPAAVAKYANMLARGDVVDRDVAGAREFLEDHVKMVSLLIPSTLESDALVYRQLMHMRRFGLGGPRDHAGADRLEKLSRRQGRVFDKPPGHSNPPGSSGKS